MPQRKSLADSSFQRPTSVPRMQKRTQTNTQTPFSNTAFAALRLEQINEAVAPWKNLIEKKNVLFSGEHPGSSISGRDEVFVILWCRANYVTLLDMMADIDPDAAQEVTKFGTYQRFMYGSMETVLIIADALMELRN